MSAEARFVLAIVLMMGVLVAGNIFFPATPATPPAAETADSIAGAAASGTAGAGAGTTGSQVGVPATGGAAGGGVAGAQAGAVLDSLGAVQGPPPPDPERVVVVESPLYRMTLSNRGARVTSVVLPGFESFTREGPVELVQAGDSGLLGARLVVGSDTVDLRDAPMQVSPADGIRLQAGGAPATLTFRGSDPETGIGYEVAYTFGPDTYVVGVRGSVTGVSRGILLTDLGWGLAFNEVDEGTEARAMAYAANHLQEGIEFTELSEVEGRTALDGPFLWVASKSRYFIAALLPEAGSTTGAAASYLGGVLVEPVSAADQSRARVAVSQAVGQGAFGFRLYAGPQDYERLTAIGSDFQEVIPVGWNWLRPVLRPITAAIMWVLAFFHRNLAIGYGWVLILVGVLMRIVLFPLNHRAMRAQLKNMAVQPLLKDIQTKYKDQPEKQQKELLKLYQEHGFNPLAGCWPLLLPWPLLIALFFVFQNTIELRGVAFAWLPDLSAKDPLFILPVLLGASMFLMQWISMRVVKDDNPQMKMMLWFLPIFMVVLFVNFPSGLNLYYLSTNVATLPQSWWLAKERQKVQVKGPPAAPAKPPARR